jgi:HD-GYP domain-containing protein (c-di-GMP phosphodiesterase class II)
MPGTPQPSEPSPAPARGPGLTPSLVGVGLGLTAALAAVLVLDPAPVRLAELRAYDLLLAGSPEPPPSADVALVGIDEESLSALGQWPWPRYRLAALVDRLREAGAGVIALDFLMPEPDRSSPGVVRAERERDGVEPASRGSAGEGDSNSERLAAALARTRSVLACQLVFPGGPERAGRLPDPPEGLIATRAPGSAAGWPVPSGALRSLPRLAAAATAEGFTNTAVDEDGAVRRTPLLLWAGARPLPSLSLAALLASTDERELAVAREEGETFLLWGARRIPLDRAGNALLRLPAGPRALPYHPARAVLDGALAPGSLRGRIVLVGAWATGLGDLHLVPPGRWARGLEIHAAAIEAIRTHRFVARPGWARGAELLALVVLGAASTLLLGRAGFKASLAVVCAGAAGCWWGGRLLLASGLHLSPLLPALAPVAVTAVLSLLKYGIEARRVEEGIRDLVRAQDEIIVGLSVLSEARDKETGLHIVRTRRYVELLARQLATTPRYRRLGESSIRLLAKSAPLHDIGKVGIPDEILHKPGRLSAGEYAVMKSHTTIGADALREIVGAAGPPEKSEFLTYAREMTVSHHEHWDGSGYPRGLRGEEIPLAGRLMALADVYDALVSRRAYKEPLGHEEARAYLRERAGSHFDPDVVDAFLAREAEFRDVARRFAERAPVSAPAPAAPA